MKRIALYASVVVLLFIAAGIGYSAGPIGVPPSTPLRASSILIVDKAGVTRVAIDAESMTFFDAQKSSRVRISYTSSATTISMRDGAGNIQFGITGDGSWGSTLTLRDKNSNEIYLRTVAGALTVMDKSNAVLWSSPPPAK